MKKDTEKKEKQEGKKFFQKVGNVIKKKWLVDGSKTIILVAIIIAIYIGVNILLENVVLPEIDCTQNKIYSLSQETKDKLKNLDKEIKITLINYSNYKSVINFEYPSNYKEGMEKYYTVNDEKNNQIAK